MAGKYALIIGNTEYSDPGLAKLTAPGKDAEDFARTLKDPDLCGFDEARILFNELSYAVIEAMDEFFDLRKPDDLLVLFFSGHGIRDEFGALYLAFRNTIRSRLLSTAIKAEYIREAMDHSRSKRQLLILDCCNSGAFPQGTKAEVGGAMGLMNAFQGYGRYVLTASDATQFAWEGDKVIGGTQNSLFTHFLVKGLEGQADRDGDGKITIDELYDYAFEEISRATPQQTPTKSASKQEGDIVLRQITRMEDIRPISLPDDLVEATEDPRTFVRESAVQQLEKLLAGKNLGLARSARTRLEKMADQDDSYHVRQMATQALAFIRQAEQKEADQQTATANPAPAELPQVQVKPPEREGDGELPPPLKDARVAEPSPKRKRVADKDRLPAQEAQAQPVAVPRSDRGAAAPPVPATQEDATPKADAQVRQPAGLPRLLIARAGAALVVLAFAAFLALKLPGSPVPAALDGISHPALAGTPIPGDLQKITTENATQVVELSRWLTGKHGMLFRAAYSPDGDLLAVGSLYGLYIYDAHTLKSYSTIGAGYGVIAAAFSPDGHMLASDLGDNIVHLWDTRDHSLIRKLEGHTERVESVAFSPDGQTLASGSSDETIRLWRVSDGSLLHTLKPLPQGVESVAFSPDGTVLASSAGDEAVRLWRVSDGSLLQTLQGHTERVDSVAFSPDGQMLASGSIDHTIRLWRVSDGTLLQTLQRHTERVASVAFSPDGQILASGSLDATVGLWRVSDGTLLQQLPVPDYYVESVTFSPDGTMLACGSLGGTTVVWGVKK